MNQQYFKVGDILRKPGRRNRLLVREVRDEHVLLYSIPFHYSAWSDPVKMYAAGYRVELGSLLEDDDVSTG